MAIEPFSIALTGIILGLLLLSGPADPISSFNNCGYGYGYGYGYGGCNNGYGYGYNTFIESPRIISESNTNQGLSGWDRIKEIIPMIPKIVVKPSFEEYFEERETLESKGSFEDITRDVVKEEPVTITKIFESIGNFFVSIFNWIGGLFR